MDEKIINNDQTQVVSEVKNDKVAASEIPSTESEIRGADEGAKPLDSPPPADVDSGESGLKQGEASVASEPSSEILASKAPDVADMKQIVQESVAEFWATLEPKLKSLWPDPPEQPAVDVAQIVRQSTTALGQTLRPELERVSSVPDQVNKSLNGFISAILDRVEDPRGRFAFNVQRSLLRGLLSLYDLLQDLEGNDGKALSDAEHRVNYRTIRTQLLQLLAVNDVKSFAPEAGTKVDAQYHRVLEVVPTGEPGEDNCIANCIRDGFTFGSTVLRPVEVTVKKYSAKAAFANASASDEG